MLSIWNDQYHFSEAPDSSGSPQQTERDLNLEIIKDLSALVNRILTTNSGVRVTDFTYIKRLSEQKKGLLSMLFFQAADIYPRFGAKELSEKAYGMVELLGAPFPVANLVCIGQKN